jgi:MFS family permease
VLTLGLYLVGSGLTALTLGQGTVWVVYLLATRFIAGAGIGGEYAAINSMIDEMIPARYRGRVDIGINGTYWAGAILGTVGALLCLNALSPSVGWRIGFLMGAALAVVIVFVRRHLPQSPRWLLMHGRAAEAEQTMAPIEARVRESGRGASTGGPVRGDRDPSGASELPRGHAGAISQPPAAVDPQRDPDDHAVVLYNAIFFTYVLVLTHF